jgi:bifunctional non-homologous end joining protein LigD
LLLARPDPEKKNGWQYAGRVGSGFSKTQLRALGKSLAVQGSAKPGFPLSGIDPELRAARWILPTVVAEVFYRGIGVNGLLRQPTLKTMREDKSPHDLKSSDRSPPPIKPKSKPAMKTKTGAAAAINKPTSGSIVVDDIAITHPDRVVFPDEGYTKQDIADYYAAVMDWFLPGVVNRPTSVIRCPEGTQKTCFFQKHAITGLTHVGKKKLKEESGDSGVYIYPKDASSVIELAQFGAIEFHPWGSDINHPNRATRVVFDLDPAPGIAWKHLIEAALLTRNLLAQLKLKSFVRTTGGKGLHVVVPLNPGCTWFDVKAFAGAFALSMANAHPTEFIATASKSKRHGKIFVDYLRNSRGATSVASYSVRARPGAPIAVPLRWEELAKLKRGDAFDIDSCRKRLSRLRKDPWQGFDTIEQSIEDVMRNLDDKPETAKTSKKKK